MRTLSAAFNLGYSPQLAALWNTLQNWDRDLAQHSRQTARLAIRLAHRLHLDATSVRALGWAGLLHDVGKMSVPRHVLDKPGALTESERRIVQTHSAYSFAILHGMQIPGELDKAVLLHHERFDGLGYPIGLKGTEIPLASRILAVADVYSALTSGRAYRGAFTSAEALTLMLNDAGQAFDPSVVQSLQCLMRAAE